MRFAFNVISKQAQEFWALLKTYPKQIAMPLAQAREADTRSEDFTSEPVGVNFMPAPEVDGLWAEVSGADRTILYFFGGGFVLGASDTRRKTAGHLALAAKARVHSISAAARLVMLSPLHVRSVQGLSATMPAHIGR